MKDHVLRRRRSKEGPSASNAKAAQSIAIIVLLFVVSWMPLYTFNTVICFCPHCPMPGPSTIKAFIVLSHCNSIWNPILYAWGMRDFRHCLGRLLGVGGGHVILVPSGSLNRYY
jgi:adenosine receptor A2a